MRIELLGAVAEQIHLHQLNFSKGCIVPLLIKAYLFNYNRLVRKQVTCYVTLNPIKRKFPSILSKL